ncbi:hypothetical protein [Micromonospora sp. NPDC049282]|uniref:hypothetical protein n=1 Tax=Micromonospora sp. NPDC049282 TaxID=3364269 RepID=UPI003711774B
MTLAPLPPEWIGVVAATVVPVAADRVPAERHFDIGDDSAAVAAELGTTAPRVALAWLRGRPEITSVIVGRRLTAHRPSRHCGTLTECQ